VLKALPTFRPRLVLAVAALLCEAAHAQNCSDYFDHALRLSEEMTQPAEFRVRMGTVIHDKLRGEQLFGVGQIARGQESGTLEANANFHWVEPREGREAGSSAWRLLRRESVQLRFYRDGDNVRIKITGGRKSLLLEPRCSAGSMHVMSNHSGATQDWVFGLPFPDTPSPDNAVLTQHNDVGRTGAYLAEKALTPKSVKPGTFGLRFVLDVDGQIYAQPLYVPHVKMDDGKYHNVLYVATSTNHVYAFDIDNSLNTKPLRSVQLGVPADPTYSTGWKSIYPNVGITSTPVIDIDKKTMYVVAKTIQYFHISGKNFSFMDDEIFALDIGSLKVADTASVSGSVAGASGRIDFDPTLQHNRASLLLLNGKVYVGYGEYNNEGDPNKNYHGWIFSFDATNLGAAPLVFNTSPNYTYAGIWQSGNGLASDGTYIYVNTGNGSVEGQSNFKENQLGDSVLKLTSNLQVAQSYTPPNVRCLDTCDLDLGSAGPVLFPNSDTLVSGAKEGIFYVFSRQDISKLSQCAFRAADQPNFSKQTPYCSLPTDQNGCEIPDAAKFCNGKGGEDWQLIAHTYSNIHGSPVVLQTGPGRYQVYVWAEENPVRMFKYSGGQLLHSFTVAPDPDGKAPPNSMPGGILSLSANSQGSNAILWGTVPKDCTIAASDNADCNLYANRFSRHGSDRLECSRTAHCL
jgi:hypothetical protein